MNVDIDTSPNTREMGRNFGPDLPNFLVFDETGGKNWDSTSSDDSENSRITSLDLALPTQKSSTRKADIGRNGVKHINYERDSQNDGFSMSKSHQEKRRDPETKADKVINTFPKSNNSFKGKKKQQFAKNGMEKSNKVVNSPDSSNLPNGNIRSNSKQFRDFSPKSSSNTFKGKKKQFAMKENAKSNKIVNGSDCVQNGVIESDLECLLDSNSCPKKKGRSYEGHVSATEKQFLKQEAQKADKVINGFDFSFLLNGNNQVDPKDLPDSNTRTKQSSKSVEKERFAESKAEKSNEVINCFDFSFLLNGSNQTDTNYLPDSDTRPKQSSKSVEKELFVESEAEKSNKVINGFDFSFLLDGSNQTDLKDLPDSNSSLKQSSKSVEKELFTESEAEKSNKVINGFDFSFLLDGDISSESKDLPESSVTIEGLKKKQSVSLADVLSTGNISSTDAEYGTLFNTQQNCSLPIWGSLGEDVVDLTNTLKKVNVDSAPHKDEKIGKVLDNSRHLLDKCRTKVKPSLLCKVLCAKLKPNDLSLVPKQPKTLPDLLESIDYWRFFKFDTPSPDDIIKQKQKSVLRRTIN